MANTSRADTSRAGTSRVRLTERESEVLRAVVTGATSREIGQRLAISENTVNFHLKNMFHKLDVRSRAQLAAWAVRAGYADEQDA